MKTTISAKYMLLVKITGNCDQQGLTYIFYPVSWLFCRSRGRRVRSLGGVSNARGSNQTRNPLEGRLQVIADWKFMIVVMRTETSYDELKWVFLSKWNQLFDSIWFLFCTIVGTWSALENAELIFHELNNFSRWFYLLCKYKENFSVTV